MFAGVDACKGGWVVAKSKAWPCREVPVLAICADFRTMLKLTEDCRRVAVDIPIGVPTGKQKRLCDIEARTFLHRFDHNPASVFFTPPRECLRAETPEELQKLHKKVTDKGAGYPVWGILSKIREANERMTPELQERIIEFHPELAWVHIGGANMESKHKPEGIAERKNLLRRNVPELERVLRWKDFLGRAAAEDDLLDALVGISVAKDSLLRTRRRLPDGALETDEMGLRMEIWY
jgi:predicted RNase H-like nuclease